MTGGGAGPSEYGGRKNAAYLRSRDIVSGRDRCCARVSIIVATVAERKRNFRCWQLRRVTDTAWRPGRNSRTTGTLLLIFTTVRSSRPSATATPSTAGYRVGGGGRDVMRYTRPRSALPPPLRRFPTDRLRPGPPPPAYDKTWRLYALAREGRCTGGGGDKGSVTLPSSAPHAHAPPARCRKVVGGRGIPPPLSSITSLPPRAGGHPSRRGVDFRGTRPT